MGWIELTARVRAMNRIMRGGEPDPDRWSPASRDNFAELHAKREKLRGRG